MMDLEKIKRRKSKVNMKGKQMKPLAFIMSVFSFVFMANLAYADDMTIEMLNKRDDGAKMV